MLYEKKQTQCFRGTYNKKHLFLLMNAWVGWCPVGLSWVQLIRIGLVYISVANWKTGQWRLGQDGLSRDNSAHLQDFVTSLQQANRVAGIQGSKQMCTRLLEAHAQNWNSLLMPHFVAQASHKASPESKARKQTPALHGRNWELSSQTRWT